MRPFAVDNVLQPRSGDPLSLNSSFERGLFSTSASYWVSHLGKKYAHMTFHHAELYGVLRGVLEAPIAKVLEKFWSQGGSHPRNEGFFLKTIYVALNFFLVSFAACVSLSYLKNMPITIQNYKNYVMLEAGLYAFYLGTDFVIDTLDPHFADLRRAISS